jgi:hypothetical protein
VLTRTGGIRDAEVSLEGLLPDIEVDVLQTTGGRAVARGLSIVSAALVLLLLISGAAAGVPCAGTSSVSASGNGACTPTAAVCPAGDYDVVIVEIVVRDCYGSTLENVAVEVSPILVAGSPSFCPGYATQTGITGPMGQLTVGFAYLGGCGHIEFQAIAEGVVLGPSNRIYIASYDSNGDLQVNLSDFVFFAGAYSTNDPCFDYGCDGMVGLTDFIFFASHYLHRCPP